MTDSTDWPVQLATTTFVAHPEELQRAQQLYAARLSEIPAEHARVLFVSAHPVGEPEGYESWFLRVTAVFEAAAAGTRAPDSLEMFSLHCVLRVNPEWAEEVSEKLFFADLTAPDPFPAMSTSVILVPHAPPTELLPVPPPPPLTAVSPVPALPHAGTWLLTLHLLAAPDEDDHLAAEYSRLLDLLQNDVAGVTLVSHSPAPERLSDDEPDAAALVAGPLWLAAARQMVSDPTASGSNPLQRWPHRARLVVDCDGDPTPFLPGSELPAAWDAEALE